MKRPPRLLFIEDDAGIAVVLYTTLIKAGYIVDTAKSGSSGIRKANARHYDLILLDLNLPDMSGLTICKRLRADGIDVPILIVSAENAVRSKDSLLDAGANDYITKPFSLEELQARIRANLQYCQEDVICESIQIGELTLHANTRSVSRRGMNIELTCKEYKILEYLMQHAGTVVTRPSLLQYAWGDSAGAWTNTVDVHVKHIRDKIDRPFEHQLIVTVHGVGYALRLTVPSLQAG